jgi:biotin transport system substrate-specific component
MTGLLSLRSSRSAVVDRLRTENASVALQVMSIVGFALLTALAAKTHFRLYLWEVPITLQTLVVYGSGLYLGSRNGMLAQLLYVALGLFFPVYAGDGYGIDYLMGAVSAGYLLSYPAAAAVVGLLSERWKSLAGSTLSTLIGAAVIFTIGVTWLHVAAGHETWMESIDKGFLRFAVIDLVKVLAVGLLYTGTRTLAGGDE